MEDNSPRKITYYPIPGDSKGGALFIYGNANAENMALVSAGFPDDQTVFAPFASRLAKETDTLVGVACIPGFDDRKDKPWTDHKRDKPNGYSFHEMASCIREAAKALRAESSCSKQKPKFTGIFHDWAVVAGSIWANRAIAEESLDAPDELVCFDVLMQPHPSTNSIPKGERMSAKQKFHGLFYQTVLALAFAAQRYVGVTVGTITLILCMIPMKLFSLGPTYHKIDGVAVKRDESFSLPRIIYMSYVYFNLFSQVGLKKTWTMCFDDDFTLPKDLSRVPVLYLYGTKKRAVFHPTSSLQILKREKGRSKSDAIAVEGAGHYLYIQEPDLCFDHVVRFMKEN